MSASSVFKAALKVLGPALLGFGTIFQPKANSTDHWSAFPQVTIQVQVAEDESGDPPRRDEDRTVVLSSTAA